MFYLHCERSVKILEQAIDQIQKWAEETGKFEAIAWDKMPEIYL